MRAEFMLGKVPKNDPYIPKMGEIVLYDKLGDGTLVTTHIGDGKTSAKDLPPLASYDIYERVKILEEEVAKLKNDRRI
jgi:hypothetical protein